MERKNQKCDIVIIGAGLTGLTLAYLLRDSGMSVNLIEARDRLGGRIYTKGLLTNQPIEMGATWLGGQHQHLKTLLKDLSISTFDQVIGDAAIYEAISTSPHYLASLPPNPQPSMRIKGGTEQIIIALVNRLNNSSILLDQQVSKITSQNESIYTYTQNQSFESKLVISTLPPNLLFNTIECIPTLPNKIIEVAQRTHTWMADSIKIGLTYNEPFWRAKNLSGTIMSNVGPINEMYDHSNFEDSYYALKGFFNSSYYSISQAERITMTIHQLKKYFGAQAENYLSYEEAVWRNEPYSYSAYNSHVLPHQNNGDPLYQKTYMDGKLIIGGTETSTHYPGYMEGAIFSALSIAQKILD